MNNILKANKKGKAGLSGWIRGFRNGGKSGAASNVQKLVAASEKSGGDYITEHERVLLTNILKLRDLSVVSVMIPRANIVAIEAGISQEDLLKLLSEKQFSRIPVYRDTLDNVLGTIHLKDVLAVLAKGERVDVEKIVTDVPIVSPAMTVLNLLLTMRESRRHIALVVDEYGGIDGLVTVNDVVESIIGEIEDEHDDEQPPQIVQKEDGSVLADARLDIDEFENRFGQILNPEEREASATLNGLVFSLAGRIPARGEILTHRTGMEFEVLDADPRRIHLLRIRNIPAPPA